MNTGDSESRCEAIISRAVKVALREARRTSAIGQSRTDREHRQRMLAPSFLVNGEEWAATLRRFNKHRNVQACLVKPTKDMSCRF